MNFQGFRIPFVLVLGLWATTAMAQSVELQKMDAGYEATQGGGTTAYVGILASAWRIDQPGAQPTDPVGIYRFFRVHGEIGYDRDGFQYTVRNYNLEFTPVSVGARQGDDKSGGIEIDGHVLDFKFVRDDAAGLPSFVYFDLGGVAVQLNSAEVNGLALRMNFIFNILSWGTDRFTDPATGKYVASQAVAPSASYGGGVGGSVDFADLLFNSDKSVRLSYDFNYRRWDGGMNALEEFRNRVTLDFVHRAGLFFEDARNQGDTYSKSTDGYGNVIYNVSASATSHRRRFGLRIFF